MLDRSLMRLCGRNTWKEGVLYLGWSGCYLEFETDSPTVRICTVTDDPLCEPHLLARLAIFWGNTVVPKQTLLLTQPESEILIETGAARGGKPVVVRIAKMSEAAFGLAGIRDIILEEGTVMQPTAAPKRRIEFVGDSITCGYGVEAAASDTFSTATENPFKAYATLVCQGLSADYELTAWSGNGVSSAWVPDTALFPNTDHLMPRLYPYRNLRMDARLGMQSPLHDFTASPVDLVVINLGTNDASWTQKKHDRIALFHDLYLGMMDEIHYFRPHTPILCVLGTLNQDLCPTVAECQKMFQSFVTRVPSSYLMLPLQVPSDGMGADGHPSQMTQMKSARLIMDKIRSMMHW